MAARANERVSSFHRDLNDVSNADLLKNRPVAIGNRVFSHRRIKLKVNMVILFFIGLLITVRQNIIFVSALSLSYIYNCIPFQKEYLLRWKGYCSLADLIKLVLYQIRCGMQII